MPERLEDARRRSSQAADYHCCRSHGDELYRPPPNGVRGHPPWTGRVGQNNVRDTQFGQRLFDRIHPGETGQPFPPHLEVAHPLIRDQHEFIGCQLGAAPSCDVKGLPCDVRRLVRGQIVRVLCREPLRNFCKQRGTLLQDLRPEPLPCHRPPVISVTCRCGGGSALALMNQPEQAGCEDIAEFLVLGTLRKGEGRVRHLSHRAADRDLACPEVINDAEPVLMIDGREESVEPLRINQQSATRDKRFLPAPGQAACMSNNRRVGILLHSEPDNRIIIQQRRRRRKLLNAQPADVIVEQEHARPSAHAAYQQAEVAFPADVERGRCDEALGQVGPQVEQVIVPRLRQECERGRVAFPEPGQNTGQPRREAVGVQRQ